jgi:FkbM family methyltransferase
MKAAEKSRIQLRRAAKFVRILTRPGYRRALRERVAPSVEHEKIRFEHDFAAVVDVGANRGQFAAFALERFPRASMYCFEPLPEPGRRLSRILEGRDSRVFPFALAAESGTADFHVARADDSSSLLPISRRQTEVFPGTDEVRREEVVTRRLDELLSPDELPRPSLLKIDVQGGELEVLRGADGIIESFDEVMVEASFTELYEGQALAGDVICHLEGRGFRLRGVYGMTFVDGAPLQGDFLFARDGAR